jgi:predicted protein tyrosine phosphatase
MGFETEPAPTIFDSRGLATRGQDNSLRRFGGNALSCLNIGSCPFEFMQKKLIHLITGKAEGWLRKLTSREKGGT